MRVTLLDADKFHELARANNAETHCLCAGFGLGRNVCRFVAVNGEVYAKLSPIAYREYSGEVHEISDTGDTAKTLKNMLGL